MKKPFFPFELGMQYENWEFKLLVAGEIIENGIFYDVYEYIGEYQKLAEVKADRIELWFNFDILEKVVYYFKLELYAELLFKLEQKLGKPAESDRLSASWCLFGVRMYLQRAEERNIVLFRF